MLKYAREDTHYLLYVYDRMKNELINKGNQENNLLKAVLKRSEDVIFIYLFIYERNIKWEIF